MKKTGSQKLEQNIFDELIKDESIMATRIMINLGISLSKPVKFWNKMGLAGDSAGKEWIVVEM